ncbi:hypothetical protein [Chitinophaga japonensis]|uniref:Fatty acid retinoid binding protein Gp-FAR-1 n=1 Tax=Chitinophaga japonensis TaxID=104662 RepID=A0A562T0P9_CHIJA|nr:hypothetical protein [Chitinophaga japonensis]TWI86570.1 fatty acid retinoid binding protein Gp-FAR-1 [Chitinophaga japonensis]
MQTENNVLTPLSADELRAVNGGFFWANEDEFLDALKAVSPGLYTMVVEFRNLVKSKIDALNPEAKTFVSGMIEKVRTLTVC